MCWTSAAEFGREGFRTVVATLTSSSSSLSKSSNENREYLRKSVYTEDDTAAWLANIGENERRVVLFPLEISFTPISTQPRELLTVAPRGSVVSQLQVDVWALAALQARLASQTSHNQRWTHSPAGSPVTSVELVSSMTSQHVPSLR
jgi:hypothetical protein